MTISTVGSNQAAATSVAIPAHQAGDLIMISAYRANNTAASVPGAGGTVPTWSSIQNTGANTVSIRTAFTVATSNNHTSGTWTNATQIIVSVWRSDNPNALLGIGQSANVGASAANITYPAITLTDPSGRSAIYRAGARVTGVAAVATPPTSYTNITSTPATPVLSAHYRLAQSVNPSADTVAMGSSTGVRGHTVEITETLTGDAVVRNFAAGEFVRWAVGTGGMATVLQGAFTWVAIVKRVGFNADMQSVLAIEAATSSRGTFRATGDSGNLDYLRGEFQSPGNGPSFAVGGGWVLVAVTKSAGETNVRYHKCVFDTEVWTHTNSAGTVENDPETATTLSTRHRDYDNDNDYLFRGRYAVMAMWNSVLSDGDIEGLRSNFSAWEAATPIWGVRFDQAATTDPIDDFTENGGDQTALTGSSVITNEYIPGWSFNGDSNEHSGGSTATVDIVTEGVGTPSASGGSTAIVDIFSEGTGSPSASGGVETEIDVFTEGSGSPNISAGSTAIVDIFTEGAGQTQPNFMGGSTTVVEVLTQGTGLLSASGGSEAIVDVITFFNPDALIKVDVTIIVGPTRGGSVEIGDTEFGSVIIGPTIQERGA